MNNSSIFKINFRDLMKGLIVTILTAVLTTISNFTTITNIDPNTIIQIAIIAGISYLAKNLATDENGKILGKI